MFDPKPRSSTLSGFISSIRGTTALQLGSRWILALALAGGTTQWTTSAQEGQGKVDLDPAQLEKTETLSEALANQLLELSVATRAQDLSRMEISLTDPLLATPLPRLDGYTPNWTRDPFRGGELQLPDTRPRSISSADWLREWQSLVGPFAKIDDARFKVSGATFETSEAGIVGRGQLKFFLVGSRSPERLLWVKGYGNIQARLPKEETVWKLTSIGFHKMSVLESFQAPFSEVSSSAGVSVTLPRYGTPGNDDFVYHGAAAADVNQDGLVDVFVTGIRRNYLYLNGGDGTFRESARESLLEITQTATAPLLLDFDQDGDLDLFLAAVGDQMLFENRLVPTGKLLFEDISEEAHVAQPAVGFSATAGDVNQDGWSDIYVASYNHYGRIMPDSWHQAGNGTRNLLYINQRDGTFQEASRAWGVDDNRWSYAAQFADVNEDGKLDLYVANDFGTNALFIQEEGTFSDQTRALRTEDPGNGMGVSFGDFDNDGGLDLFVTNMSSTAGNRILGRLIPGQGRSDNVLRKLASGNTLFRHSGKGAFQDVTADLGPFAGGWAFGGVFVDVDNDGWEDLYAPNGFVSGKSMKDT